jgi:general stress protein YciG
MNTALKEVSETTKASPVAPAEAHPASSAATSGAPASEAHTQHLTPDSPPARIDAADPSRPRRPRGFAAIDRRLLSEIASKGGKAAHTAGTAHEFTSAEAREAGRKGGLATHAKRRKTDQ